MCSLDYFYVHAANGALPGALPPPGVLKVVGIAERFALQLLRAVVDALKLLLGSEEKSHLLLLPDRMRKYDQPLRAGKRGLLALDSTSRTGGDGCR